MPRARRLPFGAEVSPGRGVAFRVWAPRRQTVEVVIEGGPGEGQTRALDAEKGGWFAGTVGDAGTGSRYRFRLDGDRLVPDPASRFQPDGPHGPSEVVDPDGFTWSDGDWRGLARRGQVLSEIHLGTFTPEGTWAAAAARLPDLRDAGITCVEVMPIADFPGNFGWGYDGVCLYAPCRLYGRPDDARRFVDRAHGLGLGVLLDVVYNHLGPDGNYLGELSAAYQSQKHQSDWGPALNFDGEDAGPVREFFVANAGYWIAEFHFDGLRLDATQAIVDDSPVHVLTEVGRRARAAAAGGRQILLHAENEDQEPRLARPEDQGGFGLDAVWNDDFHHSARVAATGFREAYYSDFLGAPQEFVSALKRGYLFQGQPYSWQGKRRGEPSGGLEPEQFVIYLDNHDQVANSARGLRLHELTSPARHRALTALLLLAPGTPLLFQGQEFGATAPFVFFADHRGDLGEAVRKGRAGLMSQFPSLASPAAQALLPNPCDPATARACVLDWRQRDEHRTMLDLHRDLLRLRREDAAIRDARAGGFDGAVLGPTAFVMRLADDRLLVVNLDGELELPHAPEPLLAPPAGRRWRTVLSSNDPKYGGDGIPELDDDQRGWRVPAETTTLLGAG